MGSRRPGHLFRGKTSLEDWVPTGPGIWNFLYRLQARVGPTGIMLIIGMKAQGGQSRVSG